MLLSAFFIVVFGLCAPTMMTKLLCTLEVVCSAALAASVGSYSCEAVQLVFYILLHPPKSLLFPESDSAKNAALFSAENLTHTQLYRRAVNLLRNDHHLRLLMYSPEIGTKIPKCLISNFLKKTKDGARRTLETNEKFESNETDTEGIFYKGERIIRIIVTNSTTPYLTITSVKGKLPQTWSAKQYLKYAKPGQCIILGSFSEKSEHPHCTLWGYNNSSTCQKTFVEKCGKGVVVDLTQCTPVEELKGQLEKAC